MTSPTNAVLDAINDCAAAFTVLDAAYPAGTAPAVQIKLQAAFSRALTAFDEIAAYHGESRASLADLCQARPTYMGGISC